MLKYRHFFFFILIASALIMASYSNVGNVGFYLDDYSSIIYNPVLQSPIDYQAVIDKHGARMVSYVLLALQSEIFNYQASGYHYAGIFFHALMVLTVYLFALQLFKQSCLQHCHRLAFITGVIFAVHPQNSQAVIYIVQQTAIYVSLFYLAAILFFILMRQSDSAIYRTLYIALLIVSSCLAMLSKQNAITLPIALLLVEWCFFKQYTKRFITVLFSFALFCLTALSLFKGFNIEQLANFINKATIENDLIPREHYFYTQIDIVAGYIYQFFYPANFRLEFDLPIISSITDVHPTSLLLHLSLLASAFYLRRKQALIAFGILFYYLTLSVESSIIPITDIAFEHRTYLPNVGLVVALTSFLNIIYEKYKQNSAFKWCALSTVLASCLYLIFTTHYRVNQWANPKLFYENEVKLSPKSARAYTELAKIYIEEKNCPLAIGVSEHAVNLYEQQRKSGLAVQPEFYQNYILCLRELGIYDKAEYLEQHILKHVREPVRRSFILFQRGTFMLSQRNFIVAEQTLTESIKLNSKNHNTAINLAITKVQLGKNGHAIKLLEHARVLKPNDQSIQDLHNKLLTNMQSSTTK